ncbi:hypothetical protein JTE90_004259 [Oedothorax gibbosus]|uniref:Uncharacterized protein n=1 Tax=Oedothorax gibbosus TaxID=931172 RepID=A0AAV6UFV3_9ARAC|nr:hypothetical protein JTE90_004259 [Oedothorax gibbosus]
MRVLLNQAGNGTEQSPVLLDFEKFTRSWIISNEVFVRALLLMVMKEFPPLCSAQIEHYLLPLAEEDEDELILDFQLDTTLTAAKRRTHVSRIFFTYPWVKIRPVP